MNFQQDSSFEERKAGAGSTQYSSLYKAVRGEMIDEPRRQRRRTMISKFGYSAKRFNVVVVVLPILLYINRIFLLDETVRLKKRVLETSSDVFVFQRLKNDDGFL